MARIDPLFISHGAPNLPLYDTPARQFLLNDGRQMPLPRAILSISAHYAALSPTLSADPAPQTIYDFGGFERELYSMTYPAPGSPELAQQAADLLAAAGLAPTIQNKRGFDHGTWVPLLLLRPQADIPVAQLSVQPRQTPRHHYEMGKALAALADDGVLVMASGAVTHNLEAFFHGQYPINAPMEGWANAFAEWLAETAAKGDTDALLAYRSTAPFAKENHPTDEHLLPFFAALGAGGAGAKGHRVHRSGQSGVLAMDVYSFGV